MIKIMYLRNVSDQYGNWFGDWLGRAVCRYVFIITLLGYAYVIWQESQLSFIILHTATLCIAIPFFIAIFLSFFATTQKENLKKEKSIKEYFITGVKDILKLAAYASMVAVVTVIVSTICNNTLNIKFEPDGLRILALLYSFFFTPFILQFFWKKLFSKE
jgi:hypothetical protein